MSGASPKHTKSGRHKACLGSCANSCHREGTENSGGWADLGQTGCLEICSQDSCRSLTPAGVQTTPSTEGRDPASTSDQEEGRQGELPHGQPLSRDKPQTSDGSYCSFSSWQAPAEPFPHILCMKNMAANANGSHQVGHQATLRKQFSQGPPEVGPIPSLVQIQKLRSAIVLVSWLKSPVGPKIPSQPSLG